MELGRTWMRGFFDDFWWHGGVPIGWGLAIFHCRIFFLVRARSTWKMGHFAGFFRLSGLPDLVGLGLVSGVSGLEKSARKLWAVEHEVHPARNPGFELAVSVSSCSLFLVHAAIVALG